LTFFLHRILTDSVRVFQTLFGCVMFAACVASAAAARVTVVLSSDAAPYQEVYQVMRAVLEDSGHDVTREYAGAVSARTLADARLAVVVGVGAADAVAAQPGRTPVLAGLVPRVWYQKTGQARLADNGRRTVSAIYLDQPFERQALLIRLAFPDARRVGVLLGNAQRGLIEDIEAGLRTQKLALSYSLVNEEQRLAMPLEAVLTEADVLLAVPDPQVLNASTAQSLLLTSYRYRDPVVGYSRSLTRAGALLSLHSSPSQIGRQAAVWVLNALSGPNVRLPAAAFPAYFSISINEQVARSLGFVVPPEDELEKRMGGEH